jgi:hypothetical protein
MKTESQTEKDVTEFTLGFGKVNVISFLMLPPIVFVLLTPFILIWGADIPGWGEVIFSMNFLLILIAGLFIHELLHGIGWAVYAKNGFRSIKFGFIWRYITPYCHCQEPLKVKHYKVGCALPFLLLGLLPSIAAIFTGNAAVLWFGIIFTLAAGGDLITLYLLRNLDNDQRVSDHPDKMGFYIENRIN